MTTTVTQVDMTILTPGDGMVLYNAESNLYSYKVYLGQGKDASAWTEVPESEIPDESESSYEDEMKSYVDNAIANALMTR